MTQAEGAAPGCPRCGDPEATGRFCAGCGAPLAAARAPSGFTRAMRAIARFRTPLVLLPLVGALVVSGGIGAQMLFEQVPGKQPEAVTVRCWDGERVVDEQDCGLPEGLAGLRWVFPSFQPGEDDCRDVLLDNPTYQRPTMWQCSVESGGAPIVITYSQLTGVKPARAFIQREYGDAERRTVRADNGTPVRYEWRRPLGDGKGFVVTSMYVALPYAVEVRARDRRVREEALASIVRFRGVSAISYR